MENKILHKRSNILGDSPDLNDLQSGELAINTGDGYLFFKKSSESGNYLCKFIDSEGQTHILNPSLSGFIPQFGNNTISEVYASILGGSGNIVDGAASSIVNGEDNKVQSDFSSTVNGMNNNIVLGANYSFIAGGQNNKISHSNVFTLGSNLSSHAANFTYVNNISAKGIIYGDGSGLTNLNVGGGSGASLSTVIDYLSTNNVLLSSAQIGSQTESTTLFVRGQKVGINTNSPNQTLTIVGNVSSTGLYYGDGSQLTGIVAGDTVATTLVRSNSANWELAPSVYTTVQNNSATTWNYQGTDIKSISGKWESAYTTVQNNSATTWDYQGTDLKNLSGKWDSTYTTVLTNSATWGTGGGGTSLSTVINYLSTNNVFLSSAQVGPQEQTTATLFARGYKVGVNTESPNQALTVVGSVSATGSYYGDGSQLTGIVAGDTVATTLVRSNSGDWQSTYTTVQNNSATTWNYQGTDIKAISGNWDSTYTTVQNNSATTWNYQGTDIKSISGKWDSTYTTVQNNSGTWGSGGGGSGLYLPLSGGNLTGNVTTTSIISSTNVMYASGARVVTGHTTDTTPVYKIRALTQVEYNALGVYDDNTIYFIKY